MALVEKSPGREMTAFAAACGRLLHWVAVTAVFGVVVASLYLAVAHGHWVAAVWCAAAGLAWVFVRGAADASLPSSRERPSE